MNSVNLIGRLTADPEPIPTTSTPAAELRLAFRQPGATATTGYVRVAVFGPGATACLRYLSRGDEVGVAGWLHYSQWADSKSGRPRDRLEVSAIAVDFLRRAPRTATEAARQADDELAQGIVGPVGSEGVD